jgi:hypothetical protein
VVVVPVVVVPVVVVPVVVVPVVVVPAVVVPAVVVPGVVVPAVVVPAVVVPAVVVPVVVVPAVVVPAVVVPAVVVPAVVVPVVVVPVALVMVVPTEFISLFGSLSLLEWLWRCMIKLPSKPMTILDSTAIVAIVPAALWPVIAVLLDFSGWTCTADLSLAELSVVIQNAAIIVATLSVINPEAGIWYILKSFFYSVAS